MTDDEMTRTNVLVVNQHGDNRGDEAAMRAMLSGLDARLVGARFTVVHQFNDPDVSCVPVDEDVTYLPMRLSILEAVRLAVAGAFRRLTPRARSIAGPIGRRILTAYDEADLVVSAPGGPYFGDIYADHEIVHWFFVWLARGGGAPLALYAPSAGPFENRVLNPLRRRGFRWFDRLLLREEVSAAHLRDLLGDVEIEVTIDSAMQELPPVDAEPSRAVPDVPEGLLDVVVCVRRPDHGSERHDRAIVDGVAEFGGVYPCRVTLLPQVHGRRSDVAYLEGLAEQMRGSGVEAIVAPWSADSDEQRRIVGDADIVIAGRYHPAVFSLAAAVPVVVIPYEHKQMGLAEAGGITEWVIDLDDLSGDHLARTLRQLHDRSAEIRARLRPVAAELRALAARTSDLVAELVLPGSTAGEGSPG